VSARDLAAYRRAAASLDAAVAAIVGDRIDERLVNAQINYHVVATLHITSEAFAAARPVLTDVRGERVQAEGAWFLRGSFGGCEVLTIEPSRPEWLDDAAAVRS